MGWERRRGCWYYYRAKRVSGRVVKEYVGSGPLAELSAAEDLERRANQRRVRLLERHEREQLAAADRAGAALAVAVDAALSLAGFHRPKRGQLRRKRNARRNQRR